MRALSVFDTGDIPKGFLYSLDVRTKTWISLVASLAAIFLSNPWPLSFVFAVSAFYAFSMKRPKIILIAYGVILLLWCMAVGMMACLHGVMPRMTPLDPTRLLAPFLRSCIIMNAVLVLALSSRIQGILLALKSMHLPFCLYVPLTVMVRFLPVFIEDFRMIRESLLIRGCLLNPLRFLLQPAFAIRLLLMPLLVRSLRASDELGIAAELKGMAPSGRMTPLERSHFRRSDVIAASAALLVLVAGVVLQQLLGGNRGGGMA